MWLRQQQSQRAIPDIPLPGRAFQQEDPQGIPRLECVECPQQVVGVLPGLWPTGHTQKSWGLPGSVLIKYLESTWAGALGSEGFHRNSEAELGYKDTSRVETEEKKLEWS